MTRRTQRGRGEGSIYQRKDGRWVAEVTLEDHSRKQFYGKTRKEAYDKLKRAQQEIEQDTLIAVSKQTVKQYLEYWLEDVHKRRVRVGTYNSYRSKIQTHIIPALGHIRLQNLTAQHVQAFYARLLEENVSAGMVRNIHSVLRRALVHAKRLKLVTYNVCEDVELPYYKQPDVKPLTQEQARTLLQKAQGHRLEAVLTVALTTGMREGELLALRWEDVSLEERTLLVRRNLMYNCGQGFIEGKPKTAKGFRTILLPQMTVDVLRKHRLLQAEEKAKVGDAWIERDLVFNGKRGDYMHAQSLRNRFARLLKEAGLPDIRFHDLRHSVVTLLLSMGADPKSVQQLVGHQDITTTLGVYGHVLLSMQQEVADKLDRFFGQK